MKDFESSRGLFNLKKIESLENCKGGEVTGRGGKTLFGKIEILRDLMTRPWLNCRGNSKSYVIETIIFNINEVEDNSSASPQIVGRSSISWIMITTIKV